MAEIEFRYTSFGHNTAVIRLTSVLGQWPRRNACVEKAGDLTFMISTSLFSRTVFCLFLCFTATLVERILESLAMSWS
jgi:hypothetical protein